MKNYERFFKLALIDILGKMNQNLRTNPKPGCGKPCIMYALEDGFGDYTRIKLCAKNGKDCDKCIAAWLQDEVR